jgi:hypothetical protein
MIIGMDEEEQRKLSVALVYRVRRRFEEAEAANRLDYSLLDILEEDIINIVEKREVAT